MKRDETPCEEETDTEVMEGELEGVSLVMPETCEPIYSWSDVTVTSTGMSVHGAEVFTGDVLSSHDLNLVEFDKSHLVQIAHQFLLLSAPECRAFDRELLSYIHTVSMNYRDNRFHNFFHAVTVLHCAIVLSRDIDSSLLCPMDRLGLYLSALVHDVNHPGHTNNFEKLIKSPLAIRYKDQSVLENHHIAVSFTLMKLPHCNFIRLLEPGVGVRLKKLMKSCILATDMMQHSALVQSVSDKKDIGFTGTDEADRTLLCTVLIHSADLFNPIRSFSVARMWAERISDEFNAQAEKETALGYPLQSFLVTKNELKLAENELFFSTKFVVPLWESLAAIFPKFDQYHGKCIENIACWERLKNLSDA